MNVLIYLTHLTLSLLLLLLTIYQIIGKDTAKKEGNCIEIDIDGSISYFHFHCSICFSCLCIFYIAALNSLFSSNYGHLVSIINY